MKKILRFKRFLTEFIDTKIFEAWRTHCSTKQGKNFYKENVSSSCMGSVNGITDKFHDHS